MTPFLCKLGPKMVIFRGFTNLLFFFRTAGLQLKLLILIESPKIFYWKSGKKVGMVLGQNLGQISSNIVKKVKKLALSIGFFPYFAWGIPFKAQGSGFTNT